MARPREFNERKALAAATRCFWSRGYGATSVRDLADSMGITGASLYNAFGDKRSLFRRALDEYVTNTFEDRVKRFEPHLPPREAIAAFFEEIVERSLADKQRRGCLLVNSALELAPHDPEFRDVIATVLARVESFFRRCVAAGQADGSITTEQSAEDVARLLLSTFLGLRVLARSSPKRELLEGLVRAAMAALGVDRALPAFPSTAPHRA